MIDPTLNTVRDQLEQVGFVEIEIMSGSMRPVLQVGHTYRLEKHPIERLARFDLIVFRQGNLFVGHYVWHVNRRLQAGSIVTRSLQNTFEDLPVRVEDYVGRIANVQLPLLTKIRLLVAALL